MQGRDPDEPHRAATPLELFFDLVFVVAVAQAASALHHGIADAHAAESVVGYLLVFFAIWWGWVNFSWFASSYDTDDIAYRIAVFVQLVGALFVAAGVERGFDERDFSLVGVGYTIMRLALVSLWLRAAAADPDPARSASAKRYAYGIVLLQVGWIGMIAVPTGWVVPVFLVLALAEMAIPWLTVADAAPRWHSGHIAERYGLFTIIVLGESILATSLAIQTAVEAGEVGADVVAIMVGAVLLVLSMWWLYFDHDDAELLGEMRVAFAWGYGHYVVLGSVAAVGAGLAVAVDVATDHAEGGLSVAGLAVSIPAAVFVLSLWALHERLGAASLVERAASPVAALALLGVAFTPQPVLLAGVVALVLVVVNVRAERALAPA